MGPASGPRATTRTAPPQNDTWIAACCLVDNLPLATLNIKDFADFTEPSSAAKSPDRHAGYHRRTSPDVARCGIYLCQSCWLWPGDPSRLRSLALSFALLSELLDPATPDTAATSRSGDLVMLERWVAASRPTVRQPRSGAWPLPAARRRRAPPGRRRCLPGRGCARRGRW